MTSIFDNTKIVGTAFVIVAILELFAAIMAIVNGFGDVPEELADTITDWKMYSIVLGIGSIICALLYSFFAFRVFSGSLSQKIEILASYVRVVGVIEVIGGVFAAIAGIAGGMDVVASILAGIFLIIIGLIIMFIAGMINDGRKTIGDKIVWIILLIVFVLMLIVEVSDLILAFNPVRVAGIASGIAGILIALFMIAFLFDSDVKSKMNM